MDQVLELGLLNVVADVMVQVTDNTQTISSFLVEKDHIGSYKTLILDIDQVLQVVVTLNGPTAVTHLRVCSDSMPVATVPSKTPTEICALGPQEISPSSSEPFYAQSPVSVVSSDGSSVKFTVSQQWTQDCSVAWTATKYASQEGVVRCDTQSDVIPEESFTYETVCEGNVALIEVYVMSPTFGDVGYISSLPESCGELSGDPANMMSHVFKIPCDCDETSAPEPSLAPVGQDNLCEVRHSIDFDDRNVAPGGYVSLQWQNYGVKITAQELPGGSGGYLPNGFPRLFDSGRPVNGTGYGTPGLSGSYGNVLVVQSSEEGEFWKANEAGGTINFDFARPVSSVELGMLNIVDAAVAVYFENGSRTVYSIKTQTETTEKILSIEDTGIVSLAVSMSGPSAVSKLNYCAGNTDDKSGGKMHNFHGTVVVVVPRLYQNTSDHNNRGGR